MEFLTIAQWLNRDRRYEFRAQYMLEPCPPAASFADFDFEVCRGSCCGPRSGWYVDRGSVRCANCGRPMRRRPMLRRPTDP